MNLSSKLLSSLLALFLFVPQAFAQDASDAPEIVPVKAARIWVPEGGFVEKGEGLYLNKTATLAVADKLGKAAEREKELVDAVNKANQEAASRFPVHTAIIIGVVGLAVGAVAGGVAVAAGQGKL